MKLRDRFWLWGHPEGRYNNNISNYGNFAVSRMTPLEGCLYLGIHKTFMVPDGWTVNRRQYNKSFEPLSDVGWECFKAYDDPGVLDQLIEEAREFTNISAAVFDDFNVKRKIWADRGIILQPEPLWDFRKRLNENDVRPIDMWMVFYTWEFGLNPEEDAAFRPFLDPFNGVIMWTWAECDVPLIPEKFEIFKSLTPHNRRMFGCYLYNFGEKKQATADAVLWQLDFYREKIMAGEAEGVVFHTNTMADLDYEAYDAARAWMRRHGDEEI